MSRSPGNSSRLEDLISSDDEVEESSPRLRGRPSGSRFATNKSSSSDQSLEIAESGGEPGESESETEVITRKKPIAKRVIYDSDESGSDSNENNSKSVLTEESGSDSSGEEEEEDSFENRALSPRTRMSITGVRPKFMTDDEDESDLIEDSSDEKKDTNQSKPKLDSPFSDDDAPEVLHEWNPESATSDRRSKISISSPRMSTNFNSSITNKLSSTIVNDSANGNAVDNNSDVLFVDSPSLTILPVKGDTIEITSSPDTSHDSATTPSKGTNDRKIQPKIINLLESNSENNNRQKSLSEVKYVSREYYDGKLKKLSELKSELTVCENLVSTLSSKLPDKGKRMSGRGDRLRSEIEELARHIATLKVEDSFKKEEKPLEKKLNAPSWDELTKAANSIQPIHTGKVGMANFIAQKTMTIERLKDIHDSLETCPGENELADDPKYLKIPLMNHQKHALAWMYWREKQKPHGGILADDMGLGKTLTMISLVLASNQRKEDEEAGDSSSSSESSDSDTPAWSTKGGKRRYHYGGTLIVCPASLIRQWESEVENRVKRGILKVCVYHGNNREPNARTLSKYDMVVTTYNLLSRECKTNAPLYTVKWERIILDEAHIIRNHKSQASEAACKIKGKYRWVLTGTPIQNREMDLYALLKFLRCSPFDELAHWKRWIDGKSAGGQQRLNTLMKSLMLRRTKEQLQTLGTVSLPEKKVETVEVSLDKDEMAVYQKVMLYSRSLFAQFLHQRAEKNQGFPVTTAVSKPNEAYYKMHQKFSRLDRNEEVKSAEILVLLLRLRQICCHPGLIDAMLEDETNTTQSSISDDSKHQEIDLLEQLNRLQINEETSLSESLNSSQEHAISKVLSKALLRTNPVFNLQRPSTKFKKVIDLVEEKIQGTSDKALIISQWTGVLELLKTHLSQKGIRTVSLNGSVPVKDRNGIVRDFNDEKSPVKIMLLSLTAGGVGLNLIGANHLLLIDLHWNPQLEAQAQDRIYRVGQKKAVHIYKFMCKETVEERIKALQDNKLAIANGVLTGAKSTEGSKLSIDDLKGLFGL